jgi:hypothetical protein
MRRSSLYLALVRFDISNLQFAFCYERPEPHRLAVAPGAIAASPGMRDQLRAGRLTEPV